MTSDGSPYGRFQKALETGNVNQDDRVEASSGRLRASSRLCWF